jgi:deoxycytidylate deaminase
MVMLNPPDYSLDWASFALGSKRKLRDLDAIFIAAPRQLSTRRITELIKLYAPQGNVLFGISSEPYVLDLEGQPQFTMLKADDLRPILDRVNKHLVNQRVYSMVYSQRDITHIIDNVRFKKVVFVNGSWYRSFHYRPEFYSLYKQRIPYEKVSPFINENEAIDYANDLRSKVEVTLPLSALPADEVLKCVRKVASQSYDFASYQVGAILAKRTVRTKRVSGYNRPLYKIVAASHNAVVPYETYAMHFGSQRESHYSPMQDMNYYDTVHAEQALLVKANDLSIDLASTSLFVNVLPCPACARMLCMTNIQEIVYSVDHSEGYAVTLLEKAGKQVRRIVQAESIIK